MIVLTKHWLELNFVLFPFALYESDWLGIRSAVVYHGNVIGTAGYQLLQWGICSDPKWGYKRFIVLGDEGYAPRSTSMPVHHEIGPQPSVTFCRYHLSQTELQDPRDPQSRNVDIYTYLI